MSIAEKLQTIAENQQKVYDAGNEKGLSVGRSVVDGTITEYKDNSVEYISGFTFYQAYALASVDAPAAAQVGTSAFYQCSALKTANLPEVTVINNGAFTSCIALNSITIPKVEAIGQSVFQNCQELRQIYIPKCFMLERSAFVSCTSLARVDMTEEKPTEYIAAAYINASAFSNCTSLATLIIRLNEVVTLQSANAFASTPIASGRGRIFVPRSMVSAYKAATNWSTYADYILAIEDYPSITKR